MKRAVWILLVFSCLNLGGIQALWACTQGETRKTTVGATFLCVDPSSGWGETWRDPSGMEWSSALPGLSNNRGSVLNAEVVDSLPAKKCEDLGGKLPTRTDWMRFLGYFSLKPNGFMTDLGASDFHSIFTDAETRTFWSASLDPVDLKDAFVLNGYDGSFVYADWNDAFSTVCVSR